MKKIVFIISLLFIINPCKAQTSEIYTDPVYYNDYIIDIVNQLDRDWDKVMNEPDQKPALVLIDSMARHSKNGLTKLNNLETFKNDGTFRDAAKEYVTHMYNIAIKELPEFMKIITSDAINTKHGSARVDELIPVLDDKRIKLFDKVVNVQKEFAIKHKFKIENQ